jgi:nitrile hydratase accessory protein
MTDWPISDADKFALAATRPGHAAEAVFAEPWEARAFALALTLGQGGQFSWDEFRDRLIAEIAKADAATSRDGQAPVADSPRGPYYECWLAALERLLREKALLNSDEIERRAAAIAASPPAPTKAKSRGPIRIA